MNKALEYFNNDDLASSVWKSKYALPEEETPDDMHDRLATEFARVESKWRLTESEVFNKMKDSLSSYGQHRSSLCINKIRDYFYGFKYIVPQGSIMSMLGNPKVGSLSNCFVVGHPYDSYGGIMQKDQELVQLMKRRGGVGIDISTLRPRGTATNNAAISSTGASSFMERFSNSTREVAQDGRRGALMISIDVRHPDVFDFVNIKKDKTKVTGANISVMLRDDFMEAVKSDSDYILRFPCNAPYDTDNGFLADECEYNVIQTGDFGVYKKIRAKELYDSIVENAWDNAEPGQIFIDKHWANSPDTVYPRYKGVTTNPCMVGSTLVLTNIGWIFFKNLDKYLGRPDFKIITQSPDGELMNSEFIWSGITQKDDEIYKIDFDNKEHLLTNAKHKFYLEDFTEVNVLDLKIGDQIISGNGLATIISVASKLDYKEDVYDLTAKPNYNFFCILNRAEIIIDNDIVINDEFKYKYFDIVKLTDGTTKFAGDLTEADDLEI